MTWSTHSLTIAWVRCWRAVVELTILKTICSVNGLALIWSFLEWSTLSYWHTIFPSCPGISSVAPYTSTTTRISAVVMISICTFVYFILVGMRMRWRDGPSLTCFPGNCSRLATSVSRYISITYSFITALFTCCLWSLADTAWYIVCGVSINVIAVYHLALSTGPISSLS